MADATNGNDVPLTAAGVLAARHLGRQAAALLAGRSVAVAHSPVPRCARTAEEITAGLHDEGVTARLLGARGHLGGPYLRNPPAALALVGQDGVAFLRRWFDGELDPALIAPAREAAEEQIDAAIACLGESAAEVVLLVSHDWNVMLVRDQIVGVRHEEAGWAGFLDGVAIAGDGARVWYGVTAAALR